MIAVRQLKRATALLPPPTLEELRLVATIRPFTMIGFRQLRTIYRLASAAVREKLEGAFVECGTANGGSGALLARIASRDGRPVWLFDSFESMPIPEEVDGPEAVAWSGRQLGREDVVHEALDRVGVHDVHVVKGWFKDTLPAAKTGPIA